MLRALITEKYEPTICHLLFYYTDDRLNMFQALLCPSSGAHDYGADYHMDPPVLGLLLVGSWVQAARTLIQLQPPVLVI